MDLRQRRMMARNGGRMPVPRIKVKVPPIGVSLGNTSNTNRQGSTWSRSEGRPLYIRVLLQFYYWYAI